MTRKAVEEIIIRNSTNYYKPYEIDTIIKFSKEIINIMFSNKDFSVNRKVFSKRGREIGEEIYKTSGYKGLSVVTEFLFQTLDEKNSRYDYYYKRDIRELECSWEGICEEFTC
jgi:hypothetical protein